VVSAEEKRSAEEGSGGGLGKRLESAGSKVNSKSEKGTGGWSGGGLAMVAGMKSLRAQLKLLRPETGLRESQ
jgi:hypothetical protein